MNTEYNLITLSFFSSCVEFGEKNHQRNHIGAVVLILNYTKTNLHLYSYDISR